LYLAVVGVADGVFVFLVQPGATADEAPVVEALTLNAE
jgi:hypothetical protein